MGTVQLPPEAGPHMYYGGGWCDMAGMWFPASSWCRVWCVTALLVQLQLQLQLVNGACRPLAVITSGSINEKASWCCL